jgi:hypothetical protein
MSCQPVYYNLTVSPLSSKNYTKPIYENYKPFKVLHLSLLLPSLISSKSELLADQCPLFSNKNELSADQCPLFSNKNELSADQ